MGCGSGSGIEEREEEEDGSEGEEREEREEREFLLWDLRVTFQISHAGF